MVFVPSNLSTCRSPRFFGETIIELKILELSSWTYSMWLIPAYHYNSPNLLHIIDIDMLFSSIILVYFHHLVYQVGFFFLGVVSESYPGCIFFFLVQENFMYGISLLIFVVLAPLTAGGTQLVANEPCKVGGLLCPCLEWDTRIYLDVPGRKLGSMG